MLSVMHADGDPDPHRGLPPLRPSPPRVRAVGWGQTDKSTPLLHGGLPMAISIHYQEAQIHHSLRCLVSTHTHTHTLALADLQKRQKSTHSPQAI